MVIFINDIPVRILKDDESPDLGQVNHTFDSRQEPIVRAKLINHVLLLNVSEAEMEVVLGFLNSNTPINLLTLIIKPLHYDAIKTYLRGQFKIVKAAGGVVRKKDKFLMIYRMKKWDLPKGKKEKGESYKQTAQRETEEECNVKVKTGKRVCTTWHTYTMNRRAMLKKTRWYVMDIVDDSRMKPSVEEDIEEVRWMNRKEVYHALEHSYQSIHYVFDHYYQLEKLAGQSG
jgi:ADP-ribose pyrophosphatase YjhB (NUDIX family)